MAHVDGTDVGPPVDGAVVEDADPASLGEVGLVPRGRAEPARRSSDLVVQRPDRPVDPSDDPSSVLVERAVLVALPPPVGEPLRRGIGRELRPGCTTELGVLGVGRGPHDGELLDGRVADDVDEVVARPGGEGEVAVARRGGTWSSKGWWGARTAPRSSVGAGARSGTGVVSNVHRYLTLLIVDAPPSTERREPRMRVELQCAESLVVLGEERHYGRAATRPHMSSPTLSRRIQRLERQHGATLLARGATGVLTLTPAGSRRSATSVPCSPCPTRAGSRTRTASTWRRRWSCRCCTTRVSLRSSWPRSGSETSARLSHAPRVLVVARDSRTVFEHVARSHGAIIIHAPQREELPAGARALPVPVGPWSGVHPMALQSPSRSAGVVPDLEAGCRAWSGTVGLPR